MAEAEDIVTVLVRRGGRSVPLKMVCDARCTQRKRGGQMRRAAQTWREQRWRPDEASSPPERAERHRAHMQPTGKTDYREQVWNGRQQKASLPHARAERAQRMALTPCYVFNRRVLQAH